MENNVMTKDELIKEGNSRCEAIGYTIETSGIDHECYIAKCKNQKGNTIIVEMPVHMLLK